MNSPIFNVQRCEVSIRTLNQEGLPKIREAEQDIFDM